LMPKSDRWQQDALWCFSRGTCISLLSMFSFLYVRLVCGVFQRVGLHALCCVCSVWMSVLGSVAAIKWVFRVVGVLGWPSVSVVLCSLIAGWSSSVLQC
jgi:hypothetical protein